MKKALVLTLILAVAGAAGLALAWPHAPAPRVAKALDARRHVGRVLVARQTALRDSYLKNRPNVARIFEGYTRRLQLIGARDCPKQFQVAWLDYQHAWTQQIKDKRQKDDAVFEDLLLTGMAVAATGPVALAARAAALNRGPNDLRKTVFDTQPAWWAVEKQSVIFNCPVPSTAFDF